MYNVNLKEQFITECAKTKHAIDLFRKIFEASGAYETKWGFDICYASTEELQPLVDELIGFRSFDIDENIKVLRDYIDWCANRGIKNVSRSIDFVDTRGISKMKRQMVTGPKQLQIYLDGLFRTDDQYTRDSIFRAFFWFAFSGIDEQDTIMIRKKHIDLATQSIVFNGEEYPIYREGLQAIQNCMNLKEFRSYNSTYITGYKLLNRADGDYLLRSTNSVPSIQSLRVQISTRIKDSATNDKTGLQLSYYRIWLSGVFYRVYQDEISGIPVDFYDISRKEVLRKFGDKDISDKTKREKISKSNVYYKRDYDRWKKTFT